MHSLADKARAVKELCNRTENVVLKTNTKKEKD